MGAGRPTKYKKGYDKQAKNLCLLGATNEELGNFFEVDDSTISRWMDSHPSFCSAIKEGREEADAKVAKSLYERALGYSHKEDKIFNSNGEALIVPTVKQYPPDTNAASLWLRNRQPAKWRDKQEVEHSGKVDTSITVKVVDSATGDALNGCTDKGENDNDSR